MTNSVYSSEPVTKLPIVLREGITSPEFDSLAAKNITLSVIPVSII